MKVGEVKELFRQLCAKYFTGATVIYGRQSRIAKPALPLVCLTAGDVHRTANPAISYIDGYEVMFYPSRIAFTVDLFTHGDPIQVGGKTVAWSDTALEDIQSFSNFLDSTYVRDWCFLNDVTVLIDGDARDMTGLLNDTNYEYRAQLTLNVYFTQRSIGRTGVMDPDSLEFLQPEKPGGEGEGQGPGEGPVDPDTGLPLPPVKEPVYSTKEPPKEESITGGSSNSWDDVNDGTIKVEVQFKPNSSGGGSEDLAQKETGYFTSADVQRVKESEVDV